MDKQVALAVAGSGKSRSIINRIDPTSRVMLITYTDNNLQNLRKRVLDKCLASIRSAEGASIRWAELFEGLASVVSVRSDN